MKLNTEYFKITLFQRYHLFTATPATVEPTTVPETTTVLEPITVPETTTVAQPTTVAEITTEAVEKTTTSEPEIPAAPGELFKYSCS